MVSNCAYVGAVDIGDDSSSAVETTDFSDENQEDAELFSDSSEQTPEAEEEEAARPAAATEKVKVGIKGSYLAASQAVLDRLNQIRREAYEEGVQDPRDSSKKLTMADYVPLKWASDLEYIARIRSAEASVRRDHLRPCNMWPESIWAPGGTTSYAENLAWSSANDMLYGINQWYGEKNDWVNQTGRTTGHYECLISPAYQYIAVSSFLNDETGWNTTSAEFCMDSRMGSKDESMSSVSGTTVQTIDVDKTQISAEIGLPDTSLEEGKTANATFKLIYKKSNSSCYPVDSVQWLSADDSIVSVDPNGKLTAKKAGTTTITLKIGDISAQKEVTVTAKVAPQPTATPKPTATPRPTATPKPTQEPVKKPKNTTSLKTKSSKKKTLVVSWKPVKSVSGYQVQYSLYKNMKKAKTKTANSKTSKVTIKNLNSKKNYYVRIRTYKTVNGKRYYSGWSSVRKLKVK